MKIRVLIEGPKHEKALQQVAKVITGWVISVFDNNLIPQTTLGDLLSGELNSILPPQLNDMRIMITDLNPGRMGQYDQHENSLDLDWDSCEDAIGMELYTIIAHELRHAFDFFSYSRPDIFISSTYKQAHSSEFARGHKAAAKYNIGLPKHAHSTADEIFHYLNLPFEIDARLTSVVARADAWADNRGTKTTFEQYKNDILRLMKDEDLINIFPDSNPNNHKIQKKDKMDILPYGNKTFRRIMSRIYKHWQEIHSEN